MKKQVLYLTLPELQDEIFPVQISAEWGTTSEVITSSFTAVITDC